MRPTSRSYPSRSTTLLQKKPASPDERRRTSGTRSSRWGVDMFQADIQNSLGGDAAATATAVPSTRRDSVSSKVSLASGKASTVGQHQQDGFRFVTVDHSRDYLPRIDWIPLDLGKWKVLSRRRCIREVQCIAMSIKWGYRTHVSFMQLHTATSLHC